MTALEALALVAAINLAAVGLFLIASGDLKTLIQRLRRRPRR